MSVKHLQPGDKAPDFELRDAEGGRVRLAETLATGKKVLLYFYPKDDTPGCIIEARDFSAHVEEFDHKNVVIYGVSKDSCAKHQMFRDKYRLKIRLLSDPDGSVIESYGCFRTGVLGIGKTALAIIRSTFLIGTDGRLEKVMYGVRASGHADFMLSQV
jgi:peroxiredoxin Q/BCP